MTVWIVFLPWDVLIYCRHLQVPLICASLFSILFNSRKNMLQWRTWELKKIPCFCLENFLGCLWIMPWAIHWCCTPLTNQFCNLSLNLSREYTFVHFRSHMCKCLLHVWQMMWCDLDQKLLLSFFTLWFLSFW